MLLSRSRLKASRWGGGRGGGNLRESRVSVTGWQSGGRSRARNAHARLEQFGEDADYISRI